jgi:hypothetical protein
MELTNDLVNFSNKKTETFSETMDRVDTNIGHVGSGSDLGDQCNLKLISKITLDSAEGPLNRKCNTNEPGFGAKDRNLHISDATSRIP